MLYFEDVLKINEGPVTIEIQKKFVTMLMSRIPAGALLTSYPGHVGGGFVHPYINCQVEVSIGPANTFLLVSVGQVKERCLVL